MQKYNIFSNNMTKTSIYLLKECYFYEKCLFFEEKTLFLHIE